MRGKWGKWETGGEVPVEGGRGRRGRVLRYTRWFFFFNRLLPLAIVGNFRFSLSLSFTIKATTPDMQT